MDGRPTIDPSRYHAIIVLTGAGISAASGIPTFRGSGGLYSDEDKVRLSSIDYFNRDPQAVWAFWSPFRQTIGDAQPNRGHQALVDLERAVAPGRRFLLITQNVDGLHAKAGTQNLIEMHGNLLRTRCSNPACLTNAFDDRTAYLDAAPTCPVCGHVQRPDIVFFGEAVAMDEQGVARALRDCDLFLAVGTSGTVFPAAHFVRNAAQAGARTILVNAEAPDPPNSFFKEVIVGTAESILPGLFD